RWRPPGVPISQWIAHWVAEDAVAITPRQRALASMHAVIHTLRRPHRDIRWQERIERPKPGRLAVAGRRREGNHLPAGMDTAIGAARALHEDRLACQPQQRRLQFALRRPPTSGRLTLEPLEACAIIG